MERLLVEGVIHKIVNVDGVVKYAGCHSFTVKHNQNHIHFSCQKCKSVACLEDIELLGGCTLFLLKLSNH